MWVAGGEADIYSRFEDLFTNRVSALGEAVLQHDAILRDLRAQVAMAPPGLWELSEDNAALARTGQEVMQEAAELSAAHATLKSEASSCQRIAQELQAERDSLLARVSAVEGAECNACDASDWAGKELDMEQRRGEEWARSLAQALQQRGQRAGRAEERAAAAEREVAQLESDSAAAGARAAAAARVAAAEVERHKGRAADLEASLARLQERRRQEDARLQEDARQLAEARAEASTLEALAEALAAELAGSERRTEETERKALVVARELLETSQGISRLRAEAASQQGLRWDLEQAQHEEGLLEQRLERARREAYALSPPSRGPGRGGSPAPAAQSRSPVEEELQHLRLSQERAAHEALRSAWEAEGRERREKQAQLEALRGAWRPLCEGLLRLSIIAQRWREDLAAGAAFAAVPPPPPEAAWCDDRHVPEAAKALCGCLEALSMEGARRLAEARAQAMTDPSTRSCFSYSATAPRMDTTAAVSALSASPSPEQLRFPASM